MAIPEAQLESWSHQGAVTTSKDTYATIKRALESPNTGYANRGYKIFLQGSYGNDTNIYAESDVDVVICHTGVFFYDLGHLSAEESAAFKNQFGGGVDYNYATFKADVQKALVAAFGDSVEPPKKAFKIAANGARRNADVVVAFEHRRYIEFKGHNNRSFYEGISFLTAAGTRIDNFPGYHSDNLTTKHQATKGRFKPAVRIFKNMRSKAMERGLLAKGEAPSYYVEGLLYNAPNTAFVGSFNDMVHAILVWLHAANDRTNFLCANERYYLLRDNEAVCWPKADGAKFISAMISLWNDWVEPPKIRFI